MKKLISLCISMAMIIQTIPALANVSTDASDGLEITSVNPVAEFTEVTELFGDSDCEVLSDGEVTDENANISDSEELSDADIFYSAVDEENWQEYCEQTKNKYRSVVKDPEMISDEKYFGVYDSELDEWTVESLLDYERCPELELIQNAVKDGDYATAKSELLNYYRAKFSSYTFPKVSADHYNSVLKMNNIYNGSAVDIGKITDNEQWYEFDLAGNVSISERVKKVAFGISAIDKDGLMAEFDSKESNNIPFLELSVNGQTRQFYPIADTTIYSGAFDSLSYGDEEKIGVCESYSSIGSGERMNKYTARGVLMFDLSELSASASIDSAVLHLYGKARQSDDPAAPVSNKGFCDVYISKISNVNWTEDDSSWKAIYGAGTPWVSYDGENLSPILQRDRSGMTTWSTLAAMYNESGDEIYAYHAVRWLAESLDKRELSVNDTHNLDNGNILKTSLQYINYILYSEHMTPNHFTIFMKWIYRMMEHACNNWEYQHEFNNFGQANSTGVFLTSQMITEYRVCDDPIYNPEPRFDGEDNGMAGGWTELGKYRFKYCFVKDMFADDSCTEVPLSYVHYLNDLIRISIEWQAYIHYDIDEIIGDDYNVNNLKNYELFLLKYSNPIFGCWQQGHDDVYNRNLSRGTEYILNLLEDPHLRYFKTNRQQGEAPEKKSYLYDQSMRAVLRSDWSENAVAAQINANGGDLKSHGQQDDLSLNVFGYGQALIQESTHKDYSYNSDSVTAWLASSKAVNAVEINNRTQRGAHSFMPYTEFGEDIEGSPKGEPGSMHPDKAELNNMYNFLHVESEAYKDYEAVGDDFTYIRDVLFVEPEFFIVVDYIDPLNNKGKVNTYKQYWHFLPEANISLNLDNTVRTNFKNSANIIVAPVDKETKLTPNIKEGYWALGSNWTYADYARYDKNQAGTTTFNTVLYPVKNGDNYNVETKNISLDVSEGVANAFEFKSTNLDSDTVDTTTFYTLFDESQKEKRDFSLFSTDGTLALVTENQAGFKRAILRNGTSLEKDDVVILDSESEISDLGVKWNGNSIELHTSKNVYTKENEKAENTTNLALEKGRTSTGSFNAGNYTLAFDGDMSTAWYSSYNEDTDKLFYPAIEADFGKKTVFSKVNIYTDGTEQFNIYRSTNGTDWEYVGITTSSGKVDGKNLCTLECGIENANYIKAAYAEKTAPVVYEFEVYEANSQSIMLDDIRIYSSSKPEYVLLNGEDTEFSYVDSYVVFGDVKEENKPEDDESDDKDKKPSSSHGSGMGGKKPSSGGGTSVIVPEIVVPGASDEAMPFEDVKKSDWYYDGVNYCRKEKLFSGVSEKVFAPEDTMTRAMFVTVLYRMSGGKAESDCGFKDVPLDSWYYDAVCWATENNIVNGTGSGEFSPDLPVTRQEMAVLLKRYDTFKCGEDESSSSIADFNDVQDVASWATDAVEWAVSRKIINGDTTGSILPLQSATRAQVAVVVQRYMNR